ncbi:hypothetical protein KY309_02545 [Candidatus Woesearchaeota archaeon]|nr:hypothetical protein [Candidatus Woesearchaeota archaeon]MBW3016465.1 hypothetical protein [Candidatus Woesearchaeota archaeon]
MKLVAEKGRLLAFPYSSSSNLTIVGTFHALNEEDKSRLESLIDESDFVALEYDDVRLNSFFDVRHRKVKTRFSREGILYCDLLNALYLNVFIYLNEWTVSEHNKVVGGGRDVDDCEFLFCHNFARKKGKRIYLVDMPNHVVAQKLMRLPFRTKIQHILSVLGANKYPDAAYDIMFRQRERYMLEEVERFEGPFENLSSKGILVVGYSHALNYARKNYEIERVNKVSAQSKC